MKLIKYFTKKQLLAAAILAERGRANRRLVVSKLEKLEDDLKFPVTTALLHNDTEIRCTIQLSETTSVELDVPLGTFNHLPSQEVA